MLSLYLTLHWQYSHRQYNKVGKSFKKSKVNGEGTVVGKSQVSGLAPHWFEGWLLPGLMSFKFKKTTLNSVPYYRHLSTPSTQLWLDCLLLTADLHASLPALQLTLIEYARADTVILPNIPQSLKYCPLSLTRFDPIEAILSLGLITGRRARPELFGSRNRTASLCVLWLLLWAVMYRLTRAQSSTHVVLASA